MPRTVLALASIASLAALACSGGQRPGRAPSPSSPAAPAPPASDPSPATSPPPAPAAGLRLEGTPPIPDALRARLDRYLSTRAASVVDVSDDGRQLLVVTRFGDSNQVHRVAGPGMARTQLTFGREPVNGASFVPGDARALIYGHDDGGDEQYQLYRLELDGGRTTRLTDGRSRNTEPVWSRDGRRLAWGSNARNGKDLDVWVSDGTGAAPPRLLVEGRGQWNPVAWSPDGTRLLVSEFVSIARSRLHLAELAAGDGGAATVRALTPATPPAAYRDAVFAADGRRAYVASDREGDVVGLYELDLASGGFRPLTPGLRWNVEGLALSGDGRWLAFVTNEGGLGRLHLLDTRTREARPVPGVPDGIVRDPVFARRAPVLAFTVASATRTGDAYVFDLRRRRLVRWTESEMGGLDTTRLVEPSLIAVRSFDGREVPAFYYRPAGPGPFPVVVQIHGGPEAQARPSFSPFLQLLAAESGIAVVEPNVRGSDGYGKAYLALDDGLKREDAVKDVGAVLDWIAARPELDARRVAVTGGSYGGFMVLASLVRFGARLRAGIDVVGISHFATFLENTAPYRRDLRRAEYGDERDPTTRAFFEAISPLRRAAEIRSALFVAQGANDPRVPASEAEQIVAAVRAAGQDVWYLLAPDEGHGFAKKGNRDAYTLLAILFLEKHLRPTPPPP